MIIDYNGLILNKFPRLPCPKCKDGVLGILKKTE